MIFSTRWHAIRGETIGAGTPHAMNVIRIQTTKDGAWQSLTDKELDQLLIEHNQMHSGKPKIDLKAQVKKLGADSLLPPSKKKAKAKK